MNIQYSVAGSYRPKDSQENLISSYRKELVNNGLNIRNNLSRNDLIIKIREYEKLSDSDSLIIPYFQMALIEAENIPISRFYFLKSFHAFILSYKLHSTDPQSEILSYYLARENIKDPLLLSLAHYCKSKILLNDRDYSSALKVLDEALGFLESMTDDKRIQDSLSIYYLNSGFVISYYLGQHETARSFINKAIEEYTFYYGTEENYLLASIHNNIGIIEKIFGNYDISLQNYQRALNIKESLGLVDDEKIMMSMVNLASLYNLMGNFDKGIELINNAEAEYTEIKESSILFSINNVKSRLYKNLGDFDKSLQYAQIALYAVENQISPNRIDLAKGYKEIGNVYTNFNRNNQAISFYRKAIQLLASNNSSQLSGIYRNLAIAYNQLGDNEVANEYFDKSIALDIAMVGREHRKLAPVYIVYGDFLRRIGELSQAERFITDALAISLRNYGPVHHITAWCYEYLADIKVEQDYPKSIRLYDDAARILAEEPSSTRGFSFPETSKLSSFQTIELFRVLEKKAYALDRHLTSRPSPNAIKEAQRHFLYLVDLIEETKAIQVSHSSKLEIAASYQDVFSRAISLSLDLYQRTGDILYAEHAFSVAERSKAGLLYEQIRENEARQYAGIPDSLLQIEATLRREIASFQKLIHDEQKAEDPDSLKLSNWEMRLLKLQTRQDQLVLSFEKFYPDYYEYKYENRIFSMQEIQQRLGASEAFLEYFLSDSLLVSFCVTPHGIHAHQQILQKPIDQLIAGLPNRQDLSTIINNPLQLYRNYAHSANELYSILLRPFKEQIKGKDLVIVPDGQLGYISFESLLAALPSLQKVDYRNLHYVLRDHSISYGYSAALLIKAMDRQPGHPRGDLLAFAPAVFDPSAPLSANASRYATRGDELVNLPQTLYEVASIGKILKGKVLMQEQATESMFKALAQSYRILHIATHGLVDNEHPMYSRLAFYREPDQYEDGYLNTYELFNMKLNAEMAVLSACNTGFGKHVKGEGLMTLARGFMYSGVPSLVISLWKVEDRSTASIMESFYQYLKEGMPKDEALRQAKLDYITSAGNLAASPYFWSSFIAIGDTQPIELRQDVRPFYLALGPAILLILLSMALLRRRYGVPGVLM